MDRLGKVLADTVDKAKMQGPMVWSTSGRKTWEQAYTNLTEDRPGLWGAVTARAEAHVLRLALIFTLLDRWHQIEDTHLNAALALWRYCDRSAAYLFGGSVGDRDADAILSALRMHPEGMTRTQINVDVFNKNRPSEHITRALGLLQRYGLAQCEPASEGRAERWFAVSPEGRTTK